MGLGTLGYESWQRVTGAPELSVEAEVKVTLGIASAGLESRGPEEAKEMPGRTLL